MNNDNVVSIYKRGKFRVARQVGMKAQPGNIESALDPYNPNRLEKSLAELAANRPADEPKP